VRRIARGVLIFLPNCVR